MENRVCCLYRVSTEKQVNYDDNHQADIPMQRKACREFADKMGWNIVREEEEDGVSGHKIRAENRDVIRTIKEAAILGEFDILLVFMFDRLGRIADETPFVLEWFFRNGIQVWSTVEGEQRFDNHVDKLTNYIRFWMADGESEKTSIRTKTALGQIVQAGGFKGGCAPYGYEFVGSGRYNKHKHELLALNVVESEAAVVRQIFDKYVNEGFGPQRISTYLNNLGYRTRKGKPWTAPSINGMLQNLTYTGVLRCSEIRAPFNPSLQIIDEDLYRRAQEVRERRSKKAEGQPTVPRNTRGQSLLAGRIYCAHCGSRLTLTTNTRENAAGEKVVRVRYVCYGKTRKQTDCDGQTGYVMKKIDGAVDEMLRKIFRQMQEVPSQSVIEAQYQRRLNDQSEILAAAQKEYKLAEKNLADLKEEVLMVIHGKSKFSSDILSDMIHEQQDVCEKALRHMQDVQKDCENLKNSVSQFERQYHELISWAEMYDCCSMEAKKMIVSHIISRVDVSAGYHLDITIDPEYRDFFSDSVEMSSHKES